MTAVAHVTRWFKDRLRRDGVTFTRHTPKVLLQGGLTLSHSPRINKPSSKKQDSQ